MQDPRLLVIHHFPCADGFTAAWAVWVKYPDAEFFPAIHHRPPPDVRDRKVLMLDFAYPRYELIGMHEVAKSLTVLDHHKSAAKDLEGLDYCQFDMLRSGAGMTWDYLFGRSTRPWLVDYIEDRDLWNWKLPNSRQVSAALDCYEFKFDVWNDLARRSVEDVAKEGEVILRYQEKSISKLIQGAREVEFRGHRVLAVNSASYMSDLGSRLAQGWPFAVVWRQTELGTYAYSLRAAEGPQAVDVSEVAKAFGGGGHAKAAGFESSTLVF